MLSITISAAKRSNLPIGGVLPALAACLIACASFASSSWSQTIPLINPGGEAYPNNGEDTAILDTNIEPGGVDPIAETGWDSSVFFSTTGNRAVQALDRNNANNGFVRMAFGATNEHVAANPTETPDTAILFQETNHIAAAGEEFVLNFFGQGFFQFDNADDDLESFFGYVDSSDNLVQVDTKAHENVVSGSWTQAGHSFLVPNGSPLIGEDLTIGFFTQALNGGYSSIDDVSLMLGAGNPPGDADGNGVVNFADVQLIADNFLNDVPVSTLGDLDDNALVDFADFRIWKDASGSNASLESIFAVPEPSAIWLAAGATLALLRRTRRGEA